MDKEEKNVYSPYEKILFLIKLLKDNLEFENNSEVSKESVIKHIEFLEKIDMDLITPEVKEAVLEQYIPGLDSVYSREVSVAKIISVIKELTIKIIGSIKANIALFNSNFSNLAINLDTSKRLIELCKADMQEIYSLKDEVNQSYDNKEFFLTQSKYLLSTAYRGDLFLNNSVGNLLMTVSNLLKQLFLDEKLKNGNEIEKKYDFETTIARLKYFLAPSEINKIATEGNSVMSYDIEEVKKDLSDLPELSKSDTESIISAIKTLNRPLLNGKPDDAQGVNLQLTNCINSLIIAWDKAQKHFTYSVKEQVKKLTETKILILDDIVTAMETVFISTDYSTDEKKEMYSNYVKLLTMGVNAYLYQLESRAYDIACYSVYLDYFVFISNLMKFLMVNYKTEMAKKSISSDSDF